MRRIFVIGVLLLIAGGIYWYFTQTGLPAGFHANNSALQTAPTNQMSEYSDPDLHFKLSYPVDLVTESFDEEESGKTITFQSDTPEIAFQIFAVPYAERAITDARFKKDEPSGVMKDPQDISIDGVSAKVFTGHNDQMGDTREVWFIHGGYLYEVTTYKALDSWLADLMTTWRFE